MAILASAYDTGHDVRFIHAAATHRSGGKLAFTELLRFTGTVSQNIAEQADRFRCVVGTNERAASQTAFRYRVSYQEEEKNDSK